MTQEISALMDGELDTAEADGIIKSCRVDAKHRDAWRCYHLIGDALRREHDHRPALEDRILTALQSEPTVLAPRRRSWVPALPRVALAAAASVLTVSAVAWLVLQQTSPTPKIEVITQAPVIQPVAVSHPEDYLRFHREFSAAPDALTPVGYGSSVSDDAQR